MVILLLSPYPQGIRETIHKYCDTVVSSNEPPEAWSYLSFDWIVSYGYRYIIKPDVIAKRQIINIHISVLPFNRGANPNFWSWVDKTQKGVTIHEVDEGIDTGPIYSRLQICLHNQHTLRSSYEELRRVAEAHFAAVWPGIRGGAVKPERLSEWEQKMGSYHRAKDKDGIFAKLPLGWDTPVAELPAASPPSGL